MSSDAVRAITNKTLFCINNPRREKAKFKKYPNP
jgi:hypothetical protein